jgi:hypothetical protein
VKNTVEEAELFSVNETPGTITTEYVPVRFGGDVRITVEVARILGQGTAPVVPAVI